MSSESGQEGNGEYDAIILLKDGDSFIKMDGCRVAFVKGANVRKAIDEIESLEGLHRRSSSNAPPWRFLVVDLNDLIDFWAKHDEKKTFSRWLEATEKAVPPYPHNTS